MKLVQLVASLSCVTAVAASCQGAQCGSGTVPGEDSDAGALLQVHRAGFGPLPHKRKLIFGTPLSGYHNVTVWVYEQAMVKLGHEVQVISKYEHAILYPMFIGEGGQGDVCEEDGCAEVCRAEGFATSPCVDFVVDSNIPVNHATWLEAYTDQFNVIGTAFVDQAIGLYAPNYTGWTTLSDAVGPDVSEADRSVLGFKSGEGDGCNTLYCPKCYLQPYLKGPPLLSETNTMNWTYVDYLCPEFDRNVAALLAEQKEFLVQMWNPQVFRVRFPDLVALNMEQYTPLLEPNHAKALIRKDRRYLFDIDAISVLGAIYLGDADVAKMDAWAHGIDLPAGRTGQLCDYESWDNNCAKEAAQLWIELNSNHGEVKGIWEMFFW